MASLDIALPFPPTTVSCNATLDAQELETLLGPTFDERTLKPDTGIVSHLWSLCPRPDPLMMMSRRVPVAPIPQR